jgi:hypothetical protein
VAVQSLQAARPNEKFAPLPAPTGKPPYHLALAELGADPTTKLVFYVIGDHGGIVDAIPQEAVAAALVADVTASGATFCYSLGDLVYFNGDLDQWYPQFYEPYDKLLLPIVGVPGNHDGDNSDNTAVASLTAFMENMCATPPPTLTQQAGDSNRDAMTQPNCYWTLVANLVTIIGLYTNVPSGGVVEPDQAAWLASELRSAPAGAPVIVTLHHPPYSADATHGGSLQMGQLIDTAARSSGRWPDLVLAGHVHDYQRFTRTVTDLGARAGQHKEIPYIVCGAGGYHNLHRLAPDVGHLPWQATADTVLNAGIDHLWGFLTVTVENGTISGTYTTVARTGTATAKADTF